MNLIDLLCEDILAVPRRSTCFSDWQLSSDLDGFITLLDGMQDNRVDGAEWQRTKAAASALALALGETLRLSLDGSPKKARDTLGNALSQVVNYLDTLRSIPLGPKQVGDLYRVRVDCTMDPGLAGMFHIPFEKRHLVRRQRYSHPGIPCLYLAQSLYCCWNEMGQPALNSMWVSRFSLAPQKTVSLVDLGWRSHWVAGMLQKKPDKEAVKFAMAYVALWPLIAACTYRSSSPEGSPFVSEYIIPQLLTEWLIDDPRGAFDGIRYPSSHIEDEAVGLAGMSIALPAKTYPNRGPCKTLGSNWQATRPVRWETVLACHSGGRSDRFGEEEITVAGQGIKYCDTQFSQVEHFLERLPLHRIEVPDTADGVLSRY